jgi:hypothetical protein
MEGTQTHRGATGMGHLRQLAMEAINKRVVALGLVLEN